MPSAYGLDRDFRLSIGFAPSVDVSDQRRNEALLAFVDRVSDGVKAGSSGHIELHYADVSPVELRPVETFCLPKEVERQALAWPSGNGVAIHPGIKQIIDENRMYEGYQACRYLNVFVHDLERAILALPGNQDLSTPLTMQQRKAVRECRSVSNSYLGGAKGVQKKRACRDYMKWVRTKNSFRRSLQKKREMLYDASIKFDMTSMVAKDLRSYDLCEGSQKPTRVTSSGKSLKMLGMAITYVSAGYNSSVTGHVAERYVYCLDGVLYDKFYNYYRLGSNVLNCFVRPGDSDPGQSPQEIEACQENQLAIQYSDHLPTVSDDYFRRQEGSVFIEFTNHPGQYVGYGKRQLMNNRDIVELWLDVDDEQMYEGLLSAKREYEEQTRRLLAGEDWDRYEILGNNCTQFVRDRLNQLGDGYEISKMEGLTPTFILGFLKKKTLRDVIIYPSQRLFRKLLMLEKGESLFMNHFTFYTKTVDTDGYAGSALIYPDYSPDSSFLWTSLSGLINLVSSLFRVTFGVLTLPLSFDEHLGWNQIEQGMTDMLFAGVEVVGQRMRYLPSTNWTEAEIEYLGRMEYQTPKVVDQLLRQAEGDSRK